jgi:hypothetical protein
MLVELLVGIDEVDDWFGVPHAARLRIAAPNTPALILLFHILISLFRYEACVMACAHDDACAHAPRTRTNAGNVPEPRFFPVGSRSSAIAYPLPSRTVTKMHRDIFYMRLYFLP